MQMSECSVELFGVSAAHDAVVATRNARGKVRLHQSLPLVAARMAVGSFTGMMMGTMLLNPLFGAVAGTGAGALSGALRGGWRISRCGLAVAVVSDHSYR